MMPVGLPGCARMDERGRRVLWGVREGWKGMRGREGARGEAAGC